MFAAHREGNPVRYSLPAALALLLLPSCKNKEGNKNGPEATRGEMALNAIYGVPNLDDDDKNGKTDWKDVGADGDNDLVALPLEGLADALLPDDRVRFELSSGADVRVWRDGEVLFDEEVLFATMGLAGLPAELAFEFGDYAVHETLLVTVLDPDDAEVWSATIDLYASPAMLSHHLLPYEKAFAVFDNGYNDEMIDEMSATMGDTFVTRDVFKYDFDVWVQDEFETATLTSPNSRIDLVIDSIRSDGWGLDDYPEDVVAKGADNYVRTWGSGYPSSQDSFGNLEVSPPVTVGGVAYPLGKIYYGLWEGLTIHDKLVEFLEDQRVQDPFTVDVSFLCVGHVDEFSTFLPDPSAPKGYRLYIADIDEGYAFLEGMDPSTPLPMFDRYHSFADVAAMLDDPALRASNEDIQRDFIDPNLEIFKAELGLDDGDVVRVPALFEESPMCGGYALSLIPGTVNMLVATGDDGGAHAFIPDPFFRDDDNVTKDADPFIAAINDLLPETLETHWVDDWFAYHMAWGEVHCGTNTLRTPTVNWWEEGLHLLDGGDR
jgi:hypothetical protein